jgi:tripartite ATP-independent transporter DctM subunit
MTSPSASATASAPASSPAPSRHPVTRALRVAEEFLAAAALAAMVVLLLLEIVVRPLYGYLIPASAVFVRQLTMWVALLGAALAARDGRLLALATGTFLGDRWRRSTEIATAAVAAGVTAILCVGGITLVTVEREMGTRLAEGLDAWMSQVVLPAGFGLIAARLVWRASPKWPGRAIALAGVALGLLVALRPELIEGTPAMLWLILIIAAGALGAPLFAVLGGLAVLLFMAGGIPPPTVLGSAYELTTHPTLPAVPLFTLGGFLLAEGDTPSRLLRVFRGLFGWMPGGTAVACVIVSAFFTIFTGGSGVTILALGGLLLPALLKDGYPDRFSIGLLTASGSLGLLLPPALPLILYAIVAEISVSEMMAGGILPGLLLIALAAGHGVQRGSLAGVPRTRFDPREAFAALWHGIWEVALPIVVLVAFFGGYATIVDTAAITAIYAFVVQVFIHRNIRLGDLRRVFAECVTTIGGVLIILAVAKGFSSYLVDAGIPSALIEWTRSYVESPYLFLLGLNVFLLIVGCLMDIFSATFVVVPLIAPMAAEFGIHPVHLGIIFIANLELGYLTPPVGLNLFLSSYRFNRPLLEVYSASVAMLIILGIGVLLITYIPWLTTALLPLVAAP